MSIRAAIDTNIIASAIIAKHPSNPLRIYQAIHVGSIVLVTADTLIAEAEELLNRPKMVKLHHLPPERIHRIITVLAQLSFVIPIESVSPITGDPDDDFLLASAYAGQADYIVSGDKRHVLPLKEFHGIPILSPKNFVMTVLSGK